MDEARNAIQWVEAHRPWVAVEQALSLSDLRYRCERIDLFELKTPEELVGLVKYAWAGLGNGVYRLGLKGSNAILVLPTIIGKWEIQLRDKGTEKIIAERPNLVSAIKGAEEVVKKYFKDSMGLVRLNSRWRHEPATLKQINLLKARKIQVPKGLTKGQASHLIGMLSQ